MLVLTPGGHEVADSRGDCHVEQQVHSHQGFLRPTAGVNDFIEMASGL